MRAALHMSDIMLRNRANLELDAENVMGDGLRNGPRGATLLKNRAHRASLPLDRTDRPPGMPSPPQLGHIDGIRPVNGLPTYVHRAICHSSQRCCTRRRCHWEGHHLLAGRLGGQAKGLVDGDGALPPPVRSVTPATSTCCL